VGIGYDNKKKTVEEKKKQIRIIHQKEMYHYLRCYLYKKKKKGEIFAYEG